MTTLNHLSLKRMHHILYPSSSASSPPPADRHYLKLWSAFVGVSPSQNHKLPTNELRTIGGTIYKQQSKWVDPIFDFRRCFFFCARTWCSTAPSRPLRTYCALPRSSPRSCICRCISSRMMRRKCSLPELSIRSL
jgi:hypothetical protein